jgi:(2R)-3-sulfolactate dehydrogenase (NADP+)
MAEISLAEIEAVSAEALRRHGAVDNVARDVARAVRRAEETGNVICGLYYLESYCLQLRTGRVQGAVEPMVTQPKPGVVQVDAGFGFAQPAFARGLAPAAEAARENGIATLAICHAHTCTSLGYFTEQIAGLGLIAIGMTNATPIVAAPGGSKRLIGTNPIAFSVPDGQGGRALHFDFSTSAVALGKIIMAAAANEAIPPIWAVDADGMPTTDPNAALKGALIGAGGHKGWGFGLMAEVLVAGLTGSLNSINVSPLKAPEGKPHDLGQLYILMDPGQNTAFYDRLATLRDAVAQDPAARLPGSRPRSHDPVTVPDKLWSLALALGS